MDSKMYINVVHRIGTEGDIDAFLKQQEICHRHHIKTTMMILPEGMNSEKIIKIVKAENENYGDEIALGLHTLDAETKKEFDVKEDMIWLTDFEVRKKILKKLFEKFKQLFGRYPGSVSSYVLDARTLNFLHENYSSVKAAITSCFEEGFKMFYGNQNMWHLFSDGGPWGAYYPSKHNALIPAANEEEFCGIVGLPHLNRDMIMAFTSRDDLFSSHVTNVIRAKAYDAKTGECPYTFDFIDMWLEQLNYNSFGYYNIFVGPAWLTDQTMLDEPGSYTVQLYEENMTYLEEKMRENKIETMTMTQFGEWFMENVQVATPEVNSWRDIICGSKRTMYWYVDPMMRVAVDGNIGGAICDLRPYVGRLNKDTGPDTENLCNMNQPYLISAEMRGGVHGGSLHTLKIRVSEKEYCIALKRTTFEVCGISKVRIMPITIKVEDVSVTFDSIMEFNGNGEILITRRLLDVSDENAKVQFVEYNRTCYGDTQYPQDMRACLMMLEDENGIEKMHYRYSSKIIEKKHIKRLQAVYPQIGTCVEMEVLSDKTTGKAEDGYLFSPFITLTAEREMKKGEEFKVCLRIKQAD